MLAHYSHGRYCFFRVIVLVVVVFVVCVFGDNVEMAEFCLLLTYLLTYLFTYLLTYVLTH